MVVGVFESVDPNQGPEDPPAGLRFHKATALSPQLLERLQHTVRKRVLRHFARHALLEPHQAEDMLTWDHGGGFSLDASVRIEATDRAGLDQTPEFDPAEPEPVPDDDFDQSRNE